MSLNNCVRHGGMSTGPGCAQCKAENDLFLLRSEFDLYKERSEAGGKDLFERLKATELQAEEFKKLADDYCAERDAVEAKWEAMNLQLQEIRERHKDVIDLTKPVGPFVGKLLDAIEKTYTVRRQGEQGDRNRCPTCKGPLISERGWHYGKCEPPVTEKRKCVECRHDDVNLGWCGAFPAPLHKLHCEPCCTIPACWRKA